MKRSEIKDLLNLLKQFGEEETKDQEELSIIQSAYDLVENSSIEFDNLVSESIADDVEDPYNEEERDYLERE